MEKEGNRQELQLISVVSFETSSEGVRNGQGSNCRFGKGFRR
jgi:hypothetical protein